MKLEEVGVKTILKRPSKDDNPGAHIGRFYGEICRAELREEESKFEKDGKRIVLALMAKYLNPKIGSERATFLVGYNWNNGSKMLKLLREFKMLPKAGEGVPLADFIGKKVEVNVDIYSGLNFIGPFIKEMRPSYGSIINEGVDDDEF